MKKFFKILMVFALLGGATLSCTKDVSQDIVDLQAQDVELQKTIEALEATLTAADNALRSDLVATQSELSTVKSNLATLKTNLEKEIADLKIKVTANATDIASLKARVAEAEDAIKALKEEDKKLGDRATELEKRADALEAALDTPETGLKARIAALEAKVIALAARIQSIVADAPVGEELKTFVFGSKKISNLEMQFTISPAECAKGLTTENCEIIVTEGLNISRADATADVNKAYTPSIVKVDANTGKVIVDANIQTKLNEESAYWVALRVKGEDEAGVISKESQFVKAVEGETWNLFDNAKWYTVKDNKEVGTTPAGDKDAVVFGKVLFTKLVDVTWQLDQPKKEKNYMNPDFKDVDIFGDYTIKFGMPDKKDWSLAEVAEKLGLSAADIVITAPATVTTIADAKNRLVTDKTAPEYKLYSFENKGAKEINLTMAYEEGSVDSKNRELVGSKAMYSYGSNAEVQKEEGIIDVFNWIIERIKDIINPPVPAPTPAPAPRFAIQIGTEVLNGFGAVYTVDLVGNTIHSLATEDELLYEWDYVHFDKTTRNCFVFEDVVWTSQLDITEVAEDWKRGHSNIYDSKTDAVVDGIADIDKTGINTFTLELDGIKFTDKTQNLYAAYKENYRNSSDVTYTTYSTELPFSVEPRHADVAVALTAADFLPIQATGNVFATTEKVFDVTFADTEAWLGVSHKTDNIAKIAAEFVPTAQTLNAAKINGVATTAANAGDFVLTLDKTNGASVKTAAGKLEYGKTYTVEFVAYTAFDVDFTYTLTVTTKAMPFSLEYTPISKNEGNVTLMGESQRTNNKGYEYWFSLEEAHFAKYLEVANADQVPATEVLTLKLGTPVLYAADDKTTAPASLGSVKINGPAAAEFLGQKNSVKEEADSPETRGTFADVQTLDWKLLGENQFRGRTVKVTGYLYAGDKKVAEKPLIFHTQEPIIKVAAKDCQITRVPGEDSVIDLYEYLDIKGVYDGYEAQLFNYVTRHGQKGWKWSSTKAAPYYQTEIVIAPVKDWTATLNGDEFVLTSANIKIEDNIVTLVRDNNPGVIVVNIPVQVKSVLDFNDPTIARVGQTATIQIVAPLGDEPQE